MVIGSSGYKKVKKRWFFKEPLTEWFFVEPKVILIWHRLKNLLKHLNFKHLNIILIKHNFGHYCEIKSDNYLYAFYHWFT